MRARPIVSNRVKPFISRADGGFCVLKCVASRCPGKGRRLIWNDEIHARLNLFRGGQAIAIGLQDLGPELGRAVVLLGDPGEGFTLTDVHGEVIQDIIA